MNTFIFNHEYIATHYNCSGRTYEEWNTYGRRNLPLGVIYFILATIYMTILLPIIVAFVKSGLMVHSCYKMMFLLGILDCVAILISGFYPAYGAIVGMVYCMAPTTNYVIGSLCVGIWGAASSMCMLLAINRCIDLINHEFAQSLFGRRRIYFWFLIPGVYFCYFFFTHSPGVYNSNVYTYFFDPFLGTPERNGSVDEKNYPHLGHSIHNISVVIVLVFTYSTLCLYIRIKSRLSSTIKVTQMQRQTFVLSFLICTGSCISAPIYVFMQFYFPPTWLVIIGHFFWLSSHGTTGISYLLFNNALRAEVKKLLYPSGLHNISKLINIPMRRIVGDQIIETPGESDVSRVVVVPVVQIYTPHD